MPARNHPGALGDLDGSGLNEQQVLSRIRAGQFNKAIDRTDRPAGSIIRANLFTLFNALLGSLLVVVLIVGPFQDALFGGVLIVNTLIGIVQELRPNGRWPASRS